MFHTSCCLLAGFAASQDIDLGALPDSYSHSTTDNKSPREGAGPESADFTHADKTVTPGQQNLATAPGSAGTALQKEGSEVSAPAGEVCV